MKKFVAQLMIFLILFGTTAPVMAQSSRYRIPTQAQSQPNAPSPSFRGQTQPTMQPGAIGSDVQMPGGMSLPQGAEGMGQMQMMGAGYQVHVLGEVIKPGTYNLPPSSRLDDAIKRAGGMALNGSERNIELRRKGGSATIVDVFLFKQSGKLNDNPYVMDNDVVFVPLRSKVVQVVGAVKRPETYELRKEKSLAEVVELAGGFNAATALKGSIRIIRFKDGEKKVEEVPIEKEKMAGYDIENGDVVVVPNIVTQKTKFDYNVASIPGDQVFYPSYEDRVFVLGGVSFPGAYEFSPYYTINQYISLAGGLSDRGADKYKIITLEGKSRRVKSDENVNPGETIMVKERWMSPAGWVAFAISFASFGLSSTATILAITRR